MHNDLNKIWYWYCIFFHFNPAGFVFLHAMILLFISAVLSEKYLTRKLVTLENYQPYAEEKDSKY